MERNKLAIVMLNFTSQISSTGNFFLDLSLNRMQVPKGESQQVSMARMV